jgi:uncharacterized protein
MNLVSLSQVPPEPWRNGGGQTQVLLAWPQAERWQLRVSVAHIDRDGPFSAFPGVQRHFVVLAGAGVALSWPARTVALSPRAEPLAFDGAEAPGCRLLDGPTDDLNLMTRQDAGRSHLQRLEPGHAWAPTARWRGLYTHEAAVLEVAGSEWPLPAGTLAWSDAPDEPAWTLHAAHAGHAFGLWLARWEEPAR